MDCPTSDILWWLRTLNQRSVRRVPGWCRSETRHSKCIRLRVCRSAARCVALPASSMKSYRKTAVRPAIAGWKGGIQIWPGSLTLIGNESGQTTWSAKYPCTKAFRAQTHKSLCNSRVHVRPFGNIPLAKFHRETRNFLQIIATVPSKTRTCLK